MRNTCVRFLTAFFMIFAIIPSAAGVYGQEKPSRVLIIYSSGNPQGSISNLKTDAVTLPTPKGMNVRVVAGKLSQSLQNRGLPVRMASASEITGPDEIIESGMVIFGSPAYFNNVSWEIKKLIDEQFIRIYSKEKRLNGLRIAAFSMAEVIPSAEATLSVIRNTVMDCQGVFGPSMALLAKQPEEEVNKQIESFAEEVFKAIKK